MVYKKGRGHPHPLEDEFTNRQSNSYKRRFLASRLDISKTLLDYDFAYQPELNKKQIIDLSSCSYIKEKKNIVFMGNPGVGKTHLANALWKKQLGQAIRF
jgi:DNA replication protein DnaC